ncbi:hypothetical protein DH2020_043170 [Rehmannia glutinosa]|uniref:Glycosyltransferase n=1 Tax=Rehmannia glutinosa TaxID=99300 RepID=A0ABR0UM91_REHGL
MKLSHQITKFGAKVTFLTTNSTHARMTSAVSESESQNNMIHIIAIPDGLEMESGWKNQEKLHESVHRVMPGYLEDLLKKTNQTPQNSDDRISGVIVDSPLAWMMGIPKKMGLKIGVFWCSSPGCLALGLKIPELIEEKIIDNDGTPLNNKSIKLLPNMPEMTTTDLMWYFPGDKNIQKSIFHITKGTIHHTINNADWILCNWFTELDPTSHNLTPNILPIGPLLANGQSSGSFCPEDSTCLSWLNTQPKNSVIYVAFGSTSKFTHQQLDELANGLVLTGRPFLWVAWAGLVKDGPSPTYYIHNFMKRVGAQGKVVEWAPQEAVLAHPSVACFVTHCGWSSFMEGLSNGVPLVCWPYFGDQMYTKSCVCGGWRVGVCLEGGGDEGGIIWRDEIRDKIEEVLCDGIIRGNALKLKEKARISVGKGGSSLVNLEVTFVNTEHIHDKILTSGTSDQDTIQENNNNSINNNNIILTSIPDGLSPEDDRNDGFKLLESLKNTMSEALVDLIEKINNSSKSDEKISCIIADTTVGWILEIAEKMGIESVGFSPSSAASLAVILHIPKLIEQGRLDVNGKARKKK